MILSEFGKDWKGKKLDEDNLSSGQMVFYKNVICYTGNRYKDIVDLHDKNYNFIESVLMYNIQLVKDGKA